jgi:hypothetical protein
MQQRFEQLMAGRHEAKLTRTERTELMSLVRGSEALRRLAARDRLVDRLLRESRKAPLNADVILISIFRSPSDLPARTMAELEQRPPVLLSVIQRVRRKVFWFSQCLADRRSIASALAIGIALIGISAGLFWFQGRSPKQIVLGKFTTVIGAPSLRHGGERSTLNAQRSTLICLGDRVETGDADRAEIQFRDGTTLRLHFNTILEIPNPKPEI